MNSTTSTPTPAQHRALTAAADLVATFGRNGGTVTARADVLRRMTVAGWVSDLGVITDHGLTAVGRANLIAPPAPAAVPVQPEYRDVHAPDGRRVLHLRIDTHHDGITVLAVVPWDTTLDRDFPTRAEADAYLAFLTEQVEGGARLWLIEQRAGAFTSAAAIVDQAEKQLAADINATMDTIPAEWAAQTAAEQAAIAADRPTETWNSYRQSLRPARPTRTNVHRKPPTPAMLDRMRQHRGGVVTCGDGQSWLLLDGIVQRGCADRNSIVYRPGTRIIASVQLNGRGWNAIGHSTAVAA
ncbi:hypothetical protein [Actinoplanes rectilineatus]|uniref:hypothetical protein n=1 Tax=Actinoplanes rectilineatus TaxID=113571 RepID=UPI0005F285C1|nr:hypothetical protein [Actinoplanes rectilineatus]